MADLDLSPEDKEAIVQILRSWEAAGEENPMLPADIDLNGDGVADAYGLDENGELVVYSGVDLEETVYVSEGDDILGDSDASEGGE